MTTIFKESFVPHEMRYQRPGNFSEAFSQELDFVRGLSDELARSKAFKAFMEKHAKEYLAAREVLAENVGRFHFLVDRLNEKTRGKIFPILKEYGIYPGFSVKVLPDGRISAKCNFLKALEMPGSVSL